MTDCIGTAVSILLANEMSKIEADTYQGQQGPKMDDWAGVGALHIVGTTQLVARVHVKPVLVLSESLVRVLVSANFGTLSDRLRVKEQTCELNITHDKVQMVRIECTREIERPAAIRALRLG